MQTVNEHAHPQRKSDHVQNEKAGPRNEAGSELPVAKFLSLGNAADSSAFSYVQMEWVAGVWGTQSPQALL